MQWFLLALIVVALLLMSTRYPRAAFAVLGVLLVAGVAVYMLSEKRQSGNGKIIPVEEIVLENPTMTPAYADSYSFSTRMLNNSSLLLSEAVVGINMLDCPTAESDDCSTLGGTEERVVVRIPSGQARDVNRNVYFRAAKPRGAVKWRYRVLSTKS